MQSNQLWFFTIWHVKVNSTVLLNSAWCQSTDWLVKWARGKSVLESSAAEDHALYRISAASCGALFTSSTERTCLCGNETPTYAAVVKPFIRSNPGFMSRAGGGVKVKSFYRLSIRSLLHPCSPFVYVSTARLHGWLDVKLTRSGKVITASRSTRAQYCIARRKCTVGVNAGH
jgi:hypothetical protein